MIFQDSASNLTIMSNNYELSDACRSGDLVKVMILVSKGAEIEHLRVGLTPLGEACSRGYLGIVKFLV